MKLNELQEKLNQYVVNEKLNTVEKQDKQNILTSKIYTKVFDLLGDRNYAIRQYKNTILLADGWWTYPVNGVYVKIIIKFKKGNAHSRYYYKQYYYINNIEVVAVRENIKSTEDIVKDVEKVKKEKENFKEKQINELKDFVKEHNITFDDLLKYTDIYNKYCFYIEKY